MINLSCNVLVTGGCGFIGTNFIKMLVETHPDCNIVNLDVLNFSGTDRNFKMILEMLNTEHSSYKFAQGNICNRELLKLLFDEYDFDVVVHFAAESHVDNSIDNPNPFIRTNIVGTSTLLEVANCNWRSRKDRNRQSLFLHVSTDEVYGSLDDEGIRFVETTPYNPRSPYSASKAASDHLVKSYYFTYEMPIIVTNCSNNYGPFQHPEKLIPKTIINCINNVEIPVYGNGQNIRDWLHVDDHCNAIIKVIQSGVPGNSYNIGGDNEIRNIDLVTTICNLLDAKLKFTFPRKTLISMVDDRLGHDYRYAIDYSKIHDWHDWEPTVLLNEGLSSTIDWYLANIDWVKMINGTS